MRANLPGLVVDKAKVLFYMAHTERAVPTETGEVDCFLKDSCGILVTAVVKWGVEIINSLYKHHMSVEVSQIAGNLNICSTTHPG